MSFITLDSSRNQDNRYAYCNGDPINASDGTGHDSSSSADLAIAGGVIGALVGIGITVASAGSLVWLGMTYTGISLTTIGVASATISGALGSVAGDATTAAIQGQPFTAARAGEDLLVGAVGGAVGATSGGPAASAAMRMAMTAAISRKLVIAIGTATSSVVGGAAGGFAGAGTQAVLHNQPLFSANTAFAALMGAGTGLGGAFIAGGVHLGFAEINGQRLTLPVEITAAEVHLIEPARAPAGYHESERVYVMSHAAESREDFGGTGVELSTREGGPRHYAIVAHGEAGRMYATLRYRGEEVYRPISAKLMAQVVANDPVFRSGQFDGATHSPDIKLISCRGGWSNAQKIADVLQQRVWASYEAVTVDQVAGFKAFEPRR